MDYSAVKKALQAVRESTKYFNKEFFTTYCKALETGRKYDKDGIDDLYHKNNISYRHRFDDVYKSDFYNKNSCCYCEFLAIVNGKDLICKT